jgi:hypothetical protein
MMALAGLTTLQQGAITEWETSETEAAQAG